MSAYVLGFATLRRLGEVHVPAAQDFPALCQPYASLHTASSQTPWARVLVKTANLECTHLMHAKLVLFALARAGGDLTACCMETGIRLA